MKLEKLSPRYRVKRLSSEDIADVFLLCAGNPIYYKHCGETITTETVVEDLKALPPGKTYADKYYVGFYDGASLIAVMDLICEYPDTETAFIGFFMTEQTRQGAGLGSTIISDCCNFLKALGFLQIKLGYAKGNVQSEAFWVKNKFVKTGVETQKEGYIAVSMIRKL